jgi:thiaminase
VNNYAPFVAHDVESKRPQWVAFWTDFYSAEPTNDTVKTLLSGLTSVASNDSKSMIDMCKEAFDSYIA